jgi:hypothetical protein
VAVLYSFARSSDYALIREILTEPRCWRRMRHPSVETFLVAPVEGIDYILAYEHERCGCDPVHDYVPICAPYDEQVERCVAGRRPVAVFLIVQGVEIHFCFVPEAWGRTLPCARAFLTWVWTYTDAKRLLGPVPIHNRLALRLACACGFKEYATRGGHVLTEIERPK